MEPYIIAIITIFGLLITMPYLSFIIIPLISLIITIIGVAIGVISFATGIISSIVLTVIAFLGILWYILN